MSNVNDSYFNGIYKEIWRSIIPDKLTQKEIEFILAYFQLQPDDKVLDMMCGYGRHSIALAQKGFAVTAVDNLPSYISEISDRAVSEKLPITSFCQDVLTFRTNPDHRLALCMGNSLNFYEERDVKKFLNNVHSSLIPGGWLLINTWSLAEIVWPAFREESAGLIMGIECKTVSRKASDPDRIESMTSFLLSDGTREEKTAVDYIYSVQEMAGFLKETGFKLKENFSIPGKQQFSEGDQRAYIIAQKIS
jgi:SAM-dependent methyltransferase